MRTPTRVVFAFACAAAACGSSPPQPPTMARPVVETARWQVVSGDAVVGHVVQLEIRDPSGPLPFYRILDLHGRWIGHATMQGRFSRRVPFQDDEQDLGVWPLPRGTAMLFDASAPVTLRPIAVEADARRD